MNKYNINVHLIVRHGRPIVENINNNINTKCESRFQNGRDLYMILIPRDPQKNFRKHLLERKLF